MRVRTRDSTVLVWHYVKGCPTHPRDCSRIRSKMLSFGASQDSTWEHKCHS